MSMIRPGGLTPNRKIVKVGDTFSPSNLKIGNQQASTRNVYDYIKLNTSGTSQTLQFFKNVNQKSFPFTNLNENKFAAGESLAVLRMHLSVLIVSQGTEGPNAIITNVVSPDYQQELRKLWRSDLNFYIDNNRVIKDLSVTSFKGDFNHSSQWGSIGISSLLTAPDVIEIQEREVTQCIYGLDDALVIPELISFRSELTIPALPSLEGITGDVYLGLHLEGFAALVSPKAKF